MKFLQILILGTVLIIVCACAPQSTFEPTATLTQSPTHIATATITNTPTITLSPTPTKTNTPEPTNTATPIPTPFGGGSGEFIYSASFMENDNIHSSFIPISYSDGALISKDKLKSILENDFIVFGTYPSPDGKSFLLIICKSLSQNDCIRDAYIATNNFSTLVPIYYMGRGDWSPNSEKIVFADRSNMTVINKDGSELIRLSSHSDYDSDPYWSPDSERLYWSKNDVLRTVNANGSDNRRLDMPDLGFSSQHLRGFEFSTDGNEVALVFADWNTNINKLIIMNNDFTDPVITELHDKLDPDTDGLSNWCVHYHIAWSSDDKYVAVSCYHKQQYFLYNTDTEKMETLPIKESAQICGWTSDNKQIVIVDDPGLFFIDLTKPELITEISDTSGEVFFAYSCPIWVPKEK